MKLNWRPKTGLEKTGVKIIQLLNRAGFKAFFVGGMVRNILLNRKSDNLDIATSASPDTVEKILDRAWIKHKSVGKQFGTILAISKDGPIEITTFRNEGRYSDKRHPDQVQFVKDYLDDAKRRDLTINALYFDPVLEEVYDPTGGLKDLKGKLIRFVGDPKKRIDEDALRMLRAVRLATLLGFKLEKNSFAAIKTRAKYIARISGERIKAELDKILLSDDPAAGLRMLDAIGLMKFIVPEMEPMKTFYHKSKMYHLEGSMFEHSLLAVKAAGKKDLDLLYALFFHDIGKPVTAKRVQKAEGWVISSRGHAEVSADLFMKFAKIHKFPKSSRDRIEWLIRNHMHFADFYKMKFFKQLTLVNHSAFELLLEHWRSDEQANKRVEYLDAAHKEYIESKHAAEKLLTSLMDKQTIIKRLTQGNLVMKLSGLKPGKQLGQKIQDIKKQIILGKIKSDADLKKYLKV